MSTSPSPAAPHEAAQSRRKDRPAALDIDQKSSSDNETRSLQLDSQVCNQLQDTLSTHLTLLETKEQPRVQVSMVEEEPLTDLEHPISRSTSTMSGLDPYYFGLQSPSDSPVPPLPISTPEHRLAFEPVTPARDPAAIDRRGLVGVGELATPRWTRATEYTGQDDPDAHLEVEKDDCEEEEVVIDDAEEDEPDSPWTIEAVDGESWEKEEEKEAPEDEVCFGLPSLGRYLIELIVIICEANH